MDNNNDYDKDPNSQNDYSSVPYSRKDLSGPSVKDWIITMIILAIPCVGIVMAFIWGFSGNEQGYRVNYAKATLIVAAIGLVFGLILSFVFIFLITAISSPFMYY